MTKLEEIGDFEGLKFVVARYNEDISWVPSLLSRFPNSKCTVYNKGDFIEDHLSYNVIVLDNMGRETETYLRHIIDNYEHIDDAVIFLQGHPFDHCPDLFNSVERAVEKLANGSGFENIGSQIIEIKDGIPTFHLEIKQELFDTHQDLKIGDFPCKFSFSAGAMFLVRHDIISNKELDFYKHCITMVEKEKGPIRGYCFERLWSLIFV